MTYLRYDWSVHSNRLKDKISKGKFFKGLSMYFAKMPLKVWKIEQLYRYFERGLKYTLLVSGLV